MIKVLRNSRTEHVMFLTLSRSISSTFFWNKSKSIKHNNSFATRRRSAEVIKKKEFEDYSENVTMKKFLEFSNQFDEEFTKSLFRRCTKAWCDKTELITEREQFYCLCWSSWNWFRRIHSDLIKKSSSQSIEKKNKKEIQRDDKYVLNAWNIDRVDATHWKFAIF